MGLSLSKFQFHFVQWVNLRGLPTFLLISIVLHGFTTAILGSALTNQKPPKFFGKESITFRARIIGSTHPQTSVTEKAKSDKSKSIVEPLAPPVNSANQSDKTELNDLPQTPSSPSAPSSNPWLRSRQFDPMQQQQIYIQQQRAFIHQQTSQQIMFLTSQLAHDFETDVKCESINNALVCQPTISSSNLNLLAMIQQLARQQLHWQLTGNPYSIQINDIKITLWL